MSVPRVRLLIPALIAAEDDLQALQRTLAGVSFRLAGLVVHPLVQLADTGERVTEPLPLALPETTIGRLAPVYLGAPSGKWGALREGLERCGPSDWVAICDGDDAYDLSALPALLARAESDGADLIQGERSPIVLDGTTLGHKRALFEPVVNMLLRRRLAEQNILLEPTANDLQSGFCLVRHELLARFLALPRMDDGVEEDALPDLPWGYYGGELHLHALAASIGAPVAGVSVKARCGRISGLSVAAIGRMLRASRYFRAVTPAECDNAVAAVAIGEGWGAEEAALAREAAVEAFPATHESGLGPDDPA